MDRFRINAPPRESNGKRTVNQYCVLSPDIKCQTLVVVPWYLLLEALRGFSKLIQTQSVHSIDKKRASDKFLL